MKAKIGKIIIGPRRLRGGVAKVAAQIRRDFGARPLAFVGVLSGCVFFLADIVRALANDSEVEFIRISSYRSGSKKSKKIETTMLPGATLRGKSVIIVDDVLDTGETLGEARRWVESFGPRSVRTAVLLTKRKKYTRRADADYSAFTIADVFVVGYGLDYDGRLRGLPYVAAIEEAK